LHSLGYYDLYSDKDSTLPLILVDPAQATLSILFSLCLPVVVLVVVDILFSKFGPQEKSLSANEVLLEKLRDLFGGLTKERDPAALKKISKKNNNHAALIIENDKPTSRLIKRSLEIERFNVIETESGTEGLSFAASLYPELIVLDSELEDMDGLQVLRRLREWTLAPIIILTDRPIEKTAKPNTGEDYYLTKRFRVEELMELIHVILRHLRHRDERRNLSIYQNSDFTLNCASRTLMVRRKEVHLTPHEYHILTFLISHGGRAVTKKMINSEFWGHHIDEDGLERYIYQLRKKIEYDPIVPKYILNEPGEGYRLEY
jgi:two-component system, OmpR family, KDP operon response regulator KdpE